MELAPVTTMMAQHSMTRARMTQDPSSLLFMSHGPDGSAAAALARACGVKDDVVTFDPERFDRGPETGQRWVVVWSDPQVTLAAALRTGLSPTAEAAAWLSFAETVLRSVARSAGNLCLVDASAVWSGDRALLGQSLPLSGDLPTPDLTPPRDTADLLAALMLPHLPDLQAAWHRLRLASLTANVSTLPQTDLDSLVAHSRELELALQERDQLRARLNLASVADEQSAGPARTEAAKEVAEEAAETALLRDQLLAVAALAAGHDVATPAVSSGEPVVHYGAFEITLLRAQLLALASLLRSDDSVTAPFQASCEVGGSAAQAEEIRLLRAHLAYLQTDLGLGSAAAPTDMSTTSLASVEAAIARVLSALVRETDRRILAERETLTARATLRSLGIEPFTTPARTAVAPRPRP
jgi:hypothetical protein